MRAHNNLGAVQNLLPSIKRGGNLRKAYINSAQNVNQEIGEEYSSE